MSAYPVLPIHAPFSLDKALEIVRMIQNQQRSAEMKAYRDQVLAAQRQSSANALRRESIRAGDVPVFQEPVDYTKDLPTGGEPPRGAREAAAALYKRSGISGSPEPYQAGDTWFVQNPQAVLEAERKRQYEEARLESVKAGTEYKRAATAAKQAPKPAEPAKLTEFDKALLGRFTTWQNSLLKGTGPEEIPTAGGEGDVLGLGAIDKLFSVQVGGGQKLTKSDRTAIVRGLQGITQEMAARGSPEGQAVLASWLPAIANADLEIPGWSEPPETGGNPLRDYFSRMGDTLRSLSQPAAQEGPSAAPGGPTGPSAARGAPDMTSETSGAAAALPGRSGAFQGAGGPMAGILGNPSEFGLAGDDWLDILDLEPGEEE